MRTSRPVPPDPADRDLPGPSRSSTAGAAYVIRSLQRSRRERRTLFVAISAIVGVWLLVVFANALADASDQTARLARERVVNTSLQAQVAAGGAEIATIQGRVFLDFLARSYAMGEPHERPFALLQGAPPPPVMSPLGQQAAPLASTTPLEDWIELLIGT